jgi:hypothetical protein
LKVPDQGAATPRQSKQDQGGHKYLLPPEAIRQHPVNRRQEDTREGEKSDQQTHLLRGDPKGLNNRREDRREGGYAHDHEEADTEDHMEIAVQEKGGCRPGDD